MTTAPYVELGFNPTDLRPRDLPRVGEFLGSPAEALEAALAVARTAMVDQMREQVRGLAEPSHAQLLRMADLTWQLVAWRYRKISAPIMADAYIRAYRRANAGDVPMSVIYDLADKHAEKIGEYFHTSSREALAEGFNLLVNRRVPAKAAADRVLDAYGLTPRQMRAYVSASQFHTPISDVLPRALKARAREYIDRSFTTRIRRLSRQEEHNIDQQAQQFAWMWLQDKGRLSMKAQKVWITAHDERVCPVCGPLHGQRVGINQQFVTKEGRFWTPGLHPNCRCVVRLLENRFAKAKNGVFAKADWDPRLHPRGGDPENPGRFSAKARTRATQPKPYAEPEPVERGKPVIETAPVDEPVEISLDEPQEVSLGQVEISLDRQVSLDNEISLDEPREVSLGEKQKKVNLGAPRREISLSGEEARAEIALHVTPLMQIEMDNELLRMIELDEQKFVPVQPPKLVRYSRPTLRIQDENQRAYPVYAVVGPMDAAFTRVSDFASLDRDTVFTPNKSKVLAQANEDFEQNIVSVAGDVVENGRNQISEWTGPIGDRMQWTANLSDEEVLEVCTWMAYQGRVQDADWAGGNPAKTLVYRGPGGEREKTYHISEVAEMMGLDSADFEVRILRMDEGHDSGLGRTRQVTAGSKYGEEDWVTEGDYRLEDATPEDVAHNLQLKIYHMVPDVEDEQYESPFD